MMFFDAPSVRFPVDRLLPARFSENPFGYRAWSAVLLNWGEAEAPLW